MNWMVRCRCSGGRFSQQRIGAWPDVRRGVGQRGFTLVELLVALALAAVISVSIMFISTQAREAYDATVKRVDVYNRFRLLMQTLENELEQWIPTGEMDYYTDGRGQGARLNQHYDPGEEQPDRSDENGPGVIDGGVFGKYDEFAYIIERQYRSREKLQTEVKLHDAYQLFFRTTLYVEGGPRLANIEYLLASPDAKWEDGKPTIPDEVDQADIPNLALYKIIRYQDITPRVILRQEEIPVTRKIIEMATNITDFRVEYTVENRFARSGAAYPGFRTPRADYEKPVELATKPTRSLQLGATGAYKKTFGYGSVDLQVSFSRATAFPAKGGDQGLTRATEHSPVRFGFSGDTKVTFGALVPGDRMFVFTAASRGEASAAGGTGNTSQLIRFPSGDYTVKTNLRGLLEFEEDIDSSSWNDEPQNNILYKAAFLPSAVRITLRIVDDRGENPKTMQRNVWLRRRSR